MKTRLISIFFAVFFFSATAVFAQTTWIVDPGGGGDFTTIQECIDTAVVGDTCQANAATYVENINFNGKDITVRSTSGPSVTIIDGGFSEAVVTFANGETGSAVLEGFTVRNGIGTGTESRYGGGIYCLNTSPLINSCIVTENQVFVMFLYEYEGFGGGIYSAGGSPTIINSTVTLNVASHGGGIYVEGGSPTIDNCNVNENTTLVFATNPFPIYMNGFGGGICSRDGDTSNIDNCDIIGNTALMGGGIHCQGSSPVITSCFIRENVTNGAGGGAWPAVGGGVAVWWAIHPTIRNSIITQNQAEMGGGIACFDSPSATITNCTLSLNFAIEGGGIYCTSASPVVTNSILWENLIDQLYVDSGSPAVTYSNIEGGWAGTGNIDADPLFYDPPYNDFHIQSESPCVDVGDNSAPALPATDIDGQPRIVPTGGVVDMGADEVPEPCGCWVLSSRSLRSTRDRVHVLLNALPYLLPLGIVFYLRRKTRV